MVISNEMRDEIWNSFTEFLVKNRWIYDEKHGVAIDTKHPGNMSSNKKLSAGQLAKKLNLWHIQRGASDSFHPPPDQSIQTKLLQMQDSCHNMVVVQEQLGKDQEELSDQLKVRVVYFAFTHILLAWILTYYFVRFRRRSTSRSC